MTRHVCVGAVLMLLINIEGTFCLYPPQDVKLVGSYLQWKKPPDEDSVLYLLQYKHGSKSDDEWYNVMSHNETELRFKITPEFYEAVFRVRAEKGYNMSEWQYSKKVQCVNANSCVPVMKLSVKPEKVYVTMEHMDESLEKEHGENIQFNVSFWKVDNGGYSKVEFIITNSRKQKLELESGQNYCFQVQYLFYEKPYGNVSNQSCAIIPEPPEMIKSRDLLFIILTTLLFTAMCGVCIFLLFKHHKKVKQLLQPLRLEIPDHYLEFLRSGDGEFPLQACPSPSSQSLQSCDMIIVIENSSVKQKGQEEEQVF
ncbi:interferon gamma receptor 2a precursor [Sinocyclocheilus rhinocerous]|uniref:Interferon gamma receptor 2a n=1 Tax=Sinocyclocheilus rhinocerous TaxID=307959 RepID=A0A673GUP2_9TELE|nr:interferon gamma receptor 2a precursor [Sinocyclocheilus rhinocerous]